MLESSLDSNLRLILKFSKIVSYQYSPNPFGSQLTSQFYSNLFYSLKAKKIIELKEDSMQMHTVYDVMKLFYAFGESRVIKTFILFSITFNDQIYASDRNCVVISKTFESSFICSSKLP